MFNKIFAALAARGNKPDQLMIDATHLKAHRTAASLLKGLFPDRIGRTKGGLNSKLHAVCDGRGRPLVMLLSEGQMSDYKGAALMMNAFPKAKTLLGDKGYDADWFRNALTERGITPCIPAKTNRKVEIDYDKTLYRQRHKIENMFQAKGLAAHPPATTDAHTFMSAICIAATVIFWL